MITFALILLFIIYSYKTDRVYYTKESEGNHRYGSQHTYVDIDTGVTMAFNNNWNAGGVERHFGFIGWGRQSFTNSFRLNSRFEYVSFMIRLPMNMEVGFQTGFVTGYNRYKPGFKIGDKLFGVCPTIRWVDPSDKNSFISYRQFGSASIHTKGWIDNNPIL